MRSTDLSTIDPHADERRRLATEFCGLLEQYPCINYYGIASGSPDQVSTQTREQMMDACRLDVEVEQGSFGNECWDEWVALIECALAAPYTCPCDGNDCLFRVPGNVGGPGGEACAGETWALIGCHADGTNGTVAGNWGECLYTLSERNGCHVSCGGDGIGGWQADCNGSAGGAQSCTCKLNGVGLCDDAVAAPDGCYPWYADDCIAVAQTMADGFCQHIVDCCFTWTADDGTSRCSCTADPTVGGFDSCEAAAQAGGGTVVDLCPRYQPALWDFPQP